MNLFKSGLASPNRIIDAYNDTIRNIVRTYDIPKDIVKEVFNIKDSYYKQMDKGNLSDESDEWLANFEASCDAVYNTSGIPKPLDDMYGYASHIRQYRKTKTNKKGGFTSMKDKYSDIVLRNFADTLDKNFSRASSDRVFRIMVGSNDYDKGYTAPDNEGSTQYASGSYSHIVNLSLTWSKNVFDNDLDVIPNGKRNVLTLTLTPDPYRHLESEGIQCFRGNFLDVRFKHRGRGQYGYEFVPEYLKDQVLLVKETSDGKMFGVGKSIHKARSLLERRQNAKVMKSMLESA